MPFNQYVISIISIFNDIYLDGRYSISTVFIDNHSSSLTNMPTYPFTDQFHHYLNTNCHFLIEISSEGICRYYSSRYNTANSINISLLLRYLYANTHHNITSDFDLLTYSPQEVLTKEEFDIIAIFSDIDNGFVLYWNNSFQYCDVSKVTSYFEVLHDIIMRDNRNLVILAGELYSINDTIVLRNSLDIHGINLVRPIVEDNTLVDIFRKIKVANGYKDIPLLFVITNRRVTNARLIKSCADLALT